MPKVVISRVYILCWDIRIGEISFQTVPSGVVGNAVIVDGYFHFTIHRQKLVIASLVDVAFGERAMLVSLFQPAYSLLSVIGIFLCTVVCIADQETTSAAFVIFNHLAVTLGLFQYPALYFLTFILYLRADYVFVAMRLKLRNIGVVHQTGISHHNEVSQSIFTNELGYRRQHRVTFIFVALMDAIGKRIAAKANEQS